jgi:hypothetical protein
MRAREPIKGRTLALTVTNGHLRKLSDPITEAFHHVPGSEPGGVSIQTRPEAQIPLMTDLHCPKSCELRGAFVLGANAIDVNGGGLACSEG